MVDDITELPIKIDPSQVGEPKPGINIIETPGLTIDETERVFLEMQGLVAGGMSVRDAAGKALEKQAIINAQTKQPPKDYSAARPVTKPTVPLRPLPLNLRTQQKAR